MTSPSQKWPVGWSDVRDEQRKMWLKATPTQRLAWMEELLELARLAGTLPGANTPKSDPRNKK